jgi:hypothetical protein
MTTTKCANRHFDANDVIIITSAASVIQEIALTAIATRTHNPTRALGGGPMTKPPDRWTEPARERAYRRLYARIDGLEDTINHFYNRIDGLEGHLENTIGHFYNVINLLRERVSVLEKKSKPEDKQTNLNQRRGS